MKDLKDYQLGYIAGLFDGEGTCSIKGQEYCQLMIYNTHNPVLSWVYKVTGIGSVSLAKNKSKSPLYQFQVSQHEDLLDFAQALLPYSIIKKESLESVIKTIQSKKWRKRSLRYLHQRKEEINYLYLEEGLSYREVAERIEWEGNPESVRCILQRYGIKRRSRSEASKLGWVKRHAKTHS